jgi:hypothetical protein
MPAGLLVLALFVPGASAEVMNGAPDLKSVGPLAFAPDAVLLVGDPAGAAIFAIETGDKTRAAAIGPITVEGVNDKVAALLGTTPQEILIQDMAVNPISGKAYLAVSRGRGPAATPVLARVDAKGKVEIVPLDKVKFSKAALPNAPTAERQKMESITDLAYVDGRVFVAGLSNEEFASKLRALSYPFKEADTGASVEIYHGSHGKFETRSPVRTFTAYTIDRQPYLLAAYTCTPLVKIPLSELKPGAHVKGTTIAELGNRNRSLDMVVYRKDGKDYILMANSSRGVMKVTTENISKVEAITTPISSTAGLTYETIASLKGVQHLDRLDAGRALLLVQNEGGALNLQTIDLP